MTTFAVRGLNVAITPHVTRDHGVSLGGVWDHEKNGMRQLREGRYGMHSDQASTRQSRVIMFAYPRSHEAPGIKHPDMDAGAIMYLPTGRYYRAPSGRMHPLTSAEGELRVPLQMTDPMQRTPGAPVDELLVDCARDAVTFYDATLQQLFACRRIADVASPRYLGPAGYQGPRDATFDHGGDHGAEGHRSRLTDFVPVSDAFSTMHTTAPMERLSPVTGASDGTSQVPRLYNTQAYADHVRDGRGFRQCYTADAKQCCGYGLTDARAPFPKLPMRNGQYDYTWTPREMQAVFGAQ